MQARESRHGVSDTHIFPRQPKSSPLHYTPHNFTGCAGPRHRTMNTPAPPRMMPHHPAKQRLQRACLTSSSSSPRHCIPSVVTTSKMSFGSGTSKMSCLFIKSNSALHPLTFRRYGHTLRCSPRESVKLRSEVFHFALLNRQHFALLNPSAERQRLSTLP